MKLIPDSLKTISKSTIIIVITGLIIAGWYLFNELYPPPPFKVRNCSEENGQVFAKIVRRNVTYTGVTTRECKFPAGTSCAELKAAKKVQFVGFGDGPGRSPCKYYEQ